MSTYDDLQAMGGEAVNEGQAYREMTRPELLEAWRASRQQAENAEAAELKLRELLWLRHGCGVEGLYGDDGEMHCSQCQIDFKRDSVRQIDERFRAIGLRALEGRQESWQSRAEAALRDLDVLEGPEEKEQG